jgi:Domain of unknown function (DUF4062)
MCAIDLARIRGTMAAVPLRVFLSHTSDLGKHTEAGSFVAAAVEAVLRARHAVTDMAYLTARDTSPAAYCIDRVAQSDVYVGIIGLRHGSPVRDRPDVSYTELEFETAGEHGQPRLIFLIREDSGYLPMKRQPAGHRARQNAFRRRLRDSGLTVVEVGARLSSSSRSSMPSSSWVRRRTRPPGSRRRRRFSPPCPRTRCPTGHHCPPAPACRWPRTRCSSGVATSCFR